MSDLVSFLATVPVLSRLDEADLREMAGACEIRTYPDQALVLQQGHTSATLFLLKQGTVAVRVRRGGRRETVAELMPPAIFGELSFLTGRTCSADVEATGPIEVAMLGSDRLAALGRSREALLQLLLTMVAGRLHDVVTGSPTLHRPRCVFVRAEEGFRAGPAFATELAAGLAQGAAGPALLVGEGVGGESEPAPAPGGGFLAVQPIEDARLAERIARWKREFRYTIVLERGHRPGLDGARRLADAAVDLIAGGGPLPPIEVPVHALAADADRARLDVLSGSRQLLFDVAEAERGFAERRDPPPRFRRTARSLARAVAGRQVGLALGGGGACCWAHIGLINTLQQAGLPIDMVAGCSMGSLVGAWFTSGRTVEEMIAFTEYWRTAYRWMVEWRFWRMHLINERRLRKALAGYFGELTLDRLEMPFWANAVDVLSGQEVIVSSGRVTDTIRASMALPGSSPAFDQGDRVLVDAAVLAPVPVGPVRAMGADFVIAMNVMPSMEAGTIPRRNPLRFFEVLNRALRISGHEIGRSRAAGDADVMLTPALEKHSLLDFGRGGEIVRAGTEVAERHRHQILAGYQRIVEART